MPARVRTYLVEAYVAGLDAPAAAVLSARLRAAVDGLRPDGVELRWLGSFALLAEETCIWLLEAAAADDVALACRRAGVQGEHVAEVTADLGG